MCGRYAIFTPPDALTERSSIPVLDVEPMDNAAPAGEVYEWAGEGEVSPASAEELRAYPVSTAFDSPANDPSGLVREVADV